MVIVGRAARFTVKELPPGLSTAAELVPASRPHMAVTEIKLTNFFKIIVVVPLVSIVRLIVF